MMMRVKMMMGDNDDDDDDDDDDYNDSDDVWVTVNDMLYRNWWQLPWQ